MSNPDRDKKASNPKVGGVKHDSRGNAVWQWASETGRNAIDSTSRLLKRLEVPGLKIDEGPPAPPAVEPPKGPAAGVPPGITPAARTRPGGKDAGGGYDPYSGSGLPRKPVQKPMAKPGARPAPQAGARVTIPASAPAPRPSLWQRLLGKR